MGSFIKSLRESKGLTQEDLVKEFSKFVGGIDVVSSVTISKWERGECFPDINKPTFEKFLTIDLLEDKAYAISRLENCYFREKDLLLALTQYFNITHPLAQLDNGKKFIKTFGFEYNKEQLTKNAIRSLIESGACINKALIANKRN